MNNENLRTLADRVCKKQAGSLMPSFDETLAMAEGVKRLLDENVRLTGLLVDEILDGAVDIPRANVTVRAADLPDGYQEVTLDDEIL
jgi:hypothetical protein